MLESRYGPEARLDAQRRAQILLRKGLSEAGYRDFVEVWRGVEAAGLETLASQKTFRRIFNGEGALKPHAEGKRAAEALASLTADPDMITEELRRCWSLGESVAGRSDGLRPAWFAVVPRQDGRTFASVDLIEIRKQKGKTISGSITRLLPAHGHEAGLRWDFRGFRRGDQGIFLTFLPIGPNNEISTGVIFLRRSPYREERYEGGYVRLDEKTGELITRKYGWYQGVPQTALPRVALLDLDRTLRPGWVVRAWLEFLASERFDGAGKCLARFDRMLEKFHDGALDHDALSNQSAQLYAALMRGKSKALVEDLASVFVAGDAETHPYTAPLIDCLRDLSVAPILVSGAPAEIASQYAARLGVEEVHALELSVGDDGFYTGTVACNPGLASVKRRITGEFRAQFRTVVLGVGDSDSDRPMLQIAENRIIVGELDPDPTWSADGLRRVDPVEGSYEDLLRWVRERVGRDDRLSLTPVMNEDLLRETRAAKRRAQRPEDFST